MQPQNWRKCRRRHCNSRALKRIQNKGSLEKRLWKLQFDWWYRGSRSVWGRCFYLCRSCGPAAGWSQRDSCSAPPWPSRDTCCHSRRCSPRRSLQGNRHSQSDKPCGNIHHRCRLGPFVSPYRSGIHAHRCYIKKGGEKKCRNSQHSFFRLTAARKRKQTRFLEGYRNKEQSRIQQEIRHWIIKEYSWKIEFLTCVYTYIKMMKRVSMFLLDQDNQPLCRRGPTTWGQNHQFLSVFGGNKTTFQSFRG